MNKSIFHIVTTFFIILTQAVIAQDSTQTSVPKKKSIKEDINILFYADAYYGYDFNDPYTGYRTPLVFNYNRHDEFNINTALANFNYTSDKIEANFGINMGSFPNAYYGGADTLYRHLYQANVKYNFSEKFDLAVGMFAPHLGFESIMSYDNMTVSHSLVSEGTPYYIAGVKGYYHFNDNFEVGIVVANGWQNLQRAPGTNQKGFGIQAHYAIENDFEISIANYSYNDGADSTDWSFYNEIWAQKYIGEKFRILGGFSYAAVPNDESISIATLIAQYKLTEQWAIALRGEYVDDKSGTYFVTANPSQEIGLSAFSANIDYQPVDKIKFRLEGRVFNGSEKIFRDDNDYNPVTPTPVKYISNAANILLTAQIKID